MQRARAHNNDGLISAEPWGLLYNDGAVVCCAFIMMTMRAKLPTVKTNAIATGPPTGLKCPGITVMIVLRSG